MVRSFVSTSTRNNKKYRYQEKKFDYKENNSNLWLAIALETVAREAKKDGNKPSLAASAVCVGVNWQKAGYPNISPGQTKLLSFLHPPCAAMPTLSWRKRAFKNSFHLLPLECNCKDNLKR